jgi:hypothetical protein
MSGGAEGARAGHGEGDATSGRPGRGAIEPSEPVLFPFVSTPCTRGLEGIRWAGTDDPRG